jgi:molybdopterin converting factor small subunit
MKATIDLKLFATLAARLPANATEFAIEAGTTIGQLIDRLEISPSEAKLIFVNGVRTELDTVLQGGERVGIFPPVGGG